MIFFQFKIAFIEYVNFLKKEQKKSQVFYTNVFFIKFNLIFLFLFLLKDVVN